MTSPPDSPFRPPETHRPDPRRLADPVSREPSTGRHGGGGGGDGSRGEPGSRWQPVPPVPGFSLLQRFVSFYTVLERELQRVTSVPARSPRPGDSQDGGTGSGSTGSGSTGSGSTGSGGTGSGSTGAATGAPSTPSAADDPYRVLETLLKSQAEGARQAHAGAFYAEAEYLMAVYADETFLSVVWPGRSAWAQQPLEQTLFGTDTGKDTVYRRMDVLLEDGGSGQAEMAKVYLLALSTGFRGRYRGAEETSHIDAYRRRLYRFAYGVPPRPGELPEGDELLLPEAYGATRSAGALDRLPAVAPWVWGFLALVGLYLSISTVLWWDDTAALRAIVDRLVGGP